MSTKIYDAYKFNGDISNLMDILYKIREDHKITIGNKFRDNYEGELEYVEIEKFLDKYYEGRSSEEMQRMHKLNSKIYVYFDEGGKSKVRENKINEIVGSQKTSDIYVQFIGCGPLLKEWCEKEWSKFFIDYHYQNQTDPYYIYEEEYESMSDDKLKELEEEYEERSETWDRIFDKYWTPREAGLCYDLSIGKFDLTRAILSKRYEEIEKK